MKKTILVTGGAGFIGSHLLDLIQTTNDYNVIVIDNLSSGSKDNIPAGITFYQQDIRSDLSEIFTKHNVHTIVHLAAQTAVNYSLQNPIEDADINIAGTLNILEQARRHKIHNIVFASSAAVYGDIDTLPIKEEYCTMPSSFYGLSKLTIEKYLQLYSNLYNINATVLRFANVYGPRQGDLGEGGVISIFSKCIRDHLPLTVYGDGTQTRDFIYVADIAKAIKYTADHATAYAIYNVSSNTELSLLELIDTFKELAPYELKINFTASKPGDIYRSILDNSQLSHAITPNTPLKKGLKTTLNYMLKG